MTKQQIKRRIERAVAKLAEVRQRATTGLVPESLTAGKLYEAHVLSVILEKMVTQEGMRVRLRPGNGQNGTRICLRSKGGPITEEFPHFDLVRGMQVIGEVWTDIEFLSLSYTRIGNGRPLTPGDYHELDIVVVSRAVRGRPTPDDILLGVECKNTTYGKDMLRQILGVRRELSFVADIGPTAFRNWPRRRIAAYPPSCLVVFATDQDAKNFEEPGKMFGIDFYHETL
jgi:hypothetical protein